MSAMKEFFDLVSKDKDVKIELGTETVKALTALLAEKGLKDDARRVLEAVTAKVAEAHGFKFGEMEELSEDEMQAVAGGKSGHCNECYNLFTCGSGED
ncbi:MAG: hypothetical protein IJG34_06420 [Synergistaceae bacterium]|nr:hypothetical protein [Synergistaceae bacterium]